MSIVTLQLIVEITVIFGVAAGTLVHLGRDGVGDVRQLLLLLLKVLGGGVRGVLLEPLRGFLDGLQDLYIMSVTMFHMRM